VRTLASPLHVRLRRPAGFYGKDNFEGLEIDQVLGVISDVIPEYSKINFVLKGDEQVCSARSRPAAAEA